MVNKKSDIKAKSTFVEEPTRSEYKMYANQEFRRIVSRKIAGWYREEAFKEKAIERMVLQRETIIDLLVSTHRQGITEVIDYLDKSGFFYRASSTYKHHNFPGGLAGHSLGTYREAVADPESRNLPEDSIIIAALLHDICKADRFWFKGRIINEHRQYGLDSKHSARSVALLKSCGLDLTEDERLAIRWHMKGDRYHSKDPRKESDHSKAIRTPLWKVVFYADKRDAGKHPGQVRSNNRKGSSKL